MALSPMLVFLPAEAPSACRVLATAACGLNLRPRLIRVGAGRGQGHAALQALGVRAQDVLDLEAVEDADALARLMDWAGPAAPASLWTCWRRDDPHLFGLADRLADALPKPPVVFEYPLDLAGPAPAGARAFVLEDGSTPPPLYLVLD